MLKHTPNGGFIETERLHLRLAVPEDDWRILNVIRADDLQNFSFFREPFTLAGERAYLEKMHKSPSDFLFLIIRKEDKRLLGSVGIHDVDFANRNARLGVSLFSREHWHRGYGSEALKALIAHAFGTMKFEKLYLNVFVDNERAQKHYEELGFRKNGTLPRHYLLVDANGNEQWHDMTHMSLLRFEWILAQQKGTV